MVHFAGLDVSVKATSVCVVDDAGKVILEQKVPTEPAEIIAVLTSLGVPLGLLPCDPEQAVLQLLIRSEIGGPAAMIAAIAPRGNRATNKAFALGAWSRQAAGLGCPLLAS